MREIVGEIFSKHSLSQWGVCSFDSVLPLIECRAKSRLPENAKSVIVALFPYYVGDCENKNLSQYAVIPDYHKIALGILTEICATLKTRFPENHFEPFVDSSPIPEVKAGYNAGLGVVGENSLLINEQYGSFVFITEIVTDLEINPDTPKQKNCLRCNKCVNACVGGAIENGKINLDRCVSNITQKKGDLSESERDLVKKGGLVWGCDVCQTVCPMNKFEKTPIKAFYENVTYVFDGEFLNDRAYAWRSPQTILRNFEILKEN